MAITSQLQNQQTRDELGSEPSVQEIYQTWFDDFVFEEGPLIIYQRVTSSDVLWGLTTWSGSVWDGDYTFDPSLTLVINNNNFFVERFKFTTLKDSSTTAYWDTTNGVLAEDSSSNHVPTYNSTALSLIVAKDTSFSGTPRIISKATIYADETIYSGDTITYELSADGGSNWETVTNETEHTFTTTGSSLMWRVTMAGHGGSSTYLSSLRIKYTSV